MHTGIVVAKDVSHHLCDLLRNQQASKEGQGEKCETDQDTAVKNGVVACWVNAVDGYQRDVTQTDLGSNDEHVLVHDQACSRWHSASLYLQQKKKDDIDCLR